MSDGTGAFGPTWHDLDGYRRAFAAGVGIALNVAVNGTLIIDAGEQTPARPGRVLDMGTASCPGQL